MAGPATAGATGADTGPPVITAGVTCTPSPPVGVAAATGDGVSTGTCAAVNPSPPLRVGMDVAGVVANGGGAGVSAADPGSIACIAPSEKDCRPGTAGCPVGTPVANGCPIGPGAKPCPTVAGEKGLLGAAETEGAIGAPVPGTDGAACRRGCCSGWHRSRRCQAHRSPHRPPAPASHHSGTPALPPPPGPPDPAPAAAGGGSRPVPPRAAATTGPSRTGPPALRRIQVVLADLARRWNIVGVKAVLARPSSGVSMDTFGVEDFLRGRHDFVDGRDGCLRRIGIAPRLDRLNFR